MRKIYFITSFLFSSFLAIGQNQTQEKHTFNSATNPENDKHLHTCLNFEDSIPIYNSSIDGSKNVIYKFKLVTISTGAYANKEILVEIDKNTFLFERQRWGGNQKTFFWVLHKTDIIINEMPLYKKTGNF
jgi:hypothetical protein